MKACATLRSVVPIYARILGRRNGVEVEIHGREAYTDGRRIVVPAVDPADPDAAVLTYAYIEHECAHLRYGDMERLQALMQARKPAPFVRHVINVFRDVLDERAMLRSYPGVRRDFQAAYGRLISDGTFSETGADDHPAGKLGAYLRYRLRREVLRQEIFAALADQSEAFARATFSLGAMTKIGSILGRVPGAIDTGQVVALAEEVASVLQDDARENPAGTAGEQQSSPDGPGTPDVAGSTATERAAARAALKATAEEMGPDVTEILASALSEKGADDGGTMRAGMGLAEEAPLRPVDADFVGSARAACNALRTRLTSLVESVRQEDEWTDRSGWDLDDALLHEVPAGRRDVFQQETDVTGIDTALLILFDRSGSMRGEAIEIARRAVLGVALAANEIRNVATCVAAFPGVGSEVAVLTEFNERAARMAGRYMLPASGGTPMAEALWWALDLLMERPEARQLLLVATDGEPANQDAVIGATQAASKLGVECLGIGINVPTQRMERLFATSRSIDRINELAPAMFGLLRESLGVRID